MVNNRAQRVKKTGVVSPKNKMHLGVETPIKAEYFEAFRANYRLKRLRIY